MEAVQERATNSSPNLTELIHEKDVDKLADSNLTIKTFEFKIRTNKKFILACEKTLDDARFVYNCALAHRISVYRYTGKSVNKFEQSRQLTEARTELPEVKTCLRSIQFDALDKLDAAFQAFFRRLKTSEKAGFPRFKGRDRYHTFSQQYERQRGCPLVGDKLKVPGVGSCRVRLSRPIEGTVKQLRITRRATGWFALLVCEMPKPKAFPKTGKTVGVDVGIRDFATLSTGEVIANPKHLSQAADNLAKLQRRLSRKVKGSTNRTKARKKVALAHLKISNTRKDFHHKVSTDLVNRFDRITVEALNVRKMVKDRNFSKAILDVAWGSFFLITNAKAVNAGREFVKKNPAYTSQTCSKCGHRQKMPLAVRIFNCQNCDHIQDRDHNAANNLNNTAELAGIYACGERDSVSVMQERVIETSVAL
jgi:putative transposase